MDVALVVVPFADVERPAIGVSLLSAELQTAGFSSCVQYLNFDLAESIGLKLYNAISESLPPECLIGEWFFADQAAAEDLPTDDQYIHRVLSRVTSGALISEIQVARRLRKSFINECAQKLLALGPRVVGFTTTFHQTCCCLAIAQQLKKLGSQAIVVFGGANCEGSMGQQLLRSFACIDYVCTREGDVAFPRLVRALLNGDSTTEIPGILSRSNASTLTTPELVTDLDALPIPDYRDYFARLEASRGRLDVKPELLVESSRGCWWGAKHHCTFCGLNGDTMAFRSKSPQRVFEEMKFLVRTYGVTRIDCVDNILDLRYVDTLFPMLEKAALGVELFYEIKANLRHDQVHRLRAGGVRSVQPGIESFSNEVLRLMRKGCSGLQNIQLLRWCAEENLVVAWNILAGFPGEPLEEYARMERLIPLLTHLRPPISCSPIRLDRFSPLYTRARELGIEGVRPNPAYYYVYALGRRELSELAYFFDFDYPDKREPDKYLQGVRREVDTWQAEYLSTGGPPRLEATRENDDLVTVRDSRRCAVRPEHHLANAHARVFWSCDIAHTRAVLATQWSSFYEQQTIDEAIDGLMDAKLMVEMEGRYLSLAVLKNRQPVTASTH